MSDLDRTSTTLGQLSPRNIAVYAYVRIRICVHAFTYVRLVLKNESLRSIRPSIDFFLLLKLRLFSNAKIVSSDSLIEDYFLGTEFHTLEISGTNCIAILCKIMSKSMIFQN